MASIETPPENKDYQDLPLRELIKAFCKLVYITIYGFPTSKTPLPDVSSKKRGKV